MAKPASTSPKADLAVIAAVIVVIVARMMLVDLRRVGLQRFEHVEDRRQHLVLDLHLGGGFLRGALAGGNHGDHRLAFPADLLVSQNGFVLWTNLYQDQDGIEIVRNIPGRNHPYDAGMLFSLRYVDRTDVGVMMRAAHHLEMQQAGKSPVGEIACLAGDMARRIRARPGLADFIEIVVAFIGEIVFPKFHCRPPQPAFRESDRAAASTALMIGSYPVQRQILPEMASTTSSRLGLGV